MDFLRLVVSPVRKASIEPESFVAFYLDSSAHRVERISVRRSVLSCVTYVHSGYSPAFGWRTINA